MTAALVFHLRDSDSQGGQGVTNVSLKASDSAGPSVGPRAQRKERWSCVMYQDPSWSSSHSLELPTSACWRAALLATMGDVARDGRLYPEQSCAPSASETEGGPVQ